MSEKLPPEILIFETDEVSCTNLCNTVERYWFTVLRAYSIEKAVRISAVNNPHVVVLGSKDSSVSLAEAAYQIRSMKGRHSIPFIFIIENDSDVESYKSLDNGLIEYITRPFTPNEVLIAIKALLRRSKPTFQDKIIKYKDLSMDLSTYKVTRGTTHVRLGPTEFKILQLLVQSPKVIFSREQIIDFVWGANLEIEHRTVDVHVNRLRSLIKTNQDEIPFIKTVRSAGYCLNLPGEIS